MKSKKLTVSLFALWCLLGIPSTEAVALEGGPSFRVQPGQYLWHVWKSPAVKQAYPDWRAYFEEVSRINDMPAEEEVWRNLPHGQIIRLPLIEDPETEALRPKLEATISMLESEVGELKKRLALAESRSTRVALVEGWSFWNWQILIILALLLVLVAVGGLAYMLKKELELTKTRLSSVITREREDAAALQFVQDNAYAYRLPSDMQSTYNAGRVVYFARGPLVRGKETVIVKGIPDPVQIAHLQRSLNNASPEVLAANCIIRVEKRGASKEPLLV